MMHVFFSSGVKSYCFIGTHSKQTRTQYSVCDVLPPPSKRNTNTCLSLSPLLTHRARLLVQKGVCSAHFNMNIIIVYLAAICFPCQKPPLASSFYSWPLWDKNHIYFPTITQMVFCVRQMIAATSIFDGREIRYASRVHFWPVPNCINGGQTGD